MPKAKLSNIDPGDRVREDYSEIKDLAESLKKHGQIQPIEVARKDSIEEFDRFETPEGGFDEDAEYLLIAGGRRYFASELLGWKDIKVSVTDNLSEIDYRERELEENLARRELKPVEEIEATQELHRLKQEKYGEGMHGPGNEDNWTQADTAEEVGKSEATVSKDLSLAQAMEEMPEVKEKASEASSKSEIRNMINKEKEQQKRDEKAEEMREKKKEGKEEEMKEALCNRYIQGDFFAVADQLPSGSFDLVELDPPYGINFDAMVDGSFGRAPSNTVYTDIDESEIDRFMTEAARRAYDLLDENGWLIFWMSGQYAERSRTWLEEAGFTLPKLPAIWNTRSGRCRNPKYNLAHDSEYFWYARKGAPTINPNSRGRSNVFTIRRVKHSARYHDNQAPIRLYEAIFKTFASPDSKLLSGFAGSGSAILAAHNLGMDALGVDVDRDGKYKNSYESKVWNGELGEYNDE